MINNTFVDFPFLNFDLPLAAGYTIPFNQPCYTPPLPLTTHNNYTMEWGLVGLSSISFICLLGYEAWNKPTGLYAFWNKTCKVIESARDSIYKTGLAFFNSDRSETIKKDNVIFNRPITRHDL